MGIFNKIKQVLGMQTEVVRRREDFYCSTECQKYFKTYLRSNMNGNYTIRCPNCGHHHNRVIKDGHVTDDRCNDTSAQNDILIGLKSTIRDTPFETDSPEGRRAQMGLI